MSTPHLFPRAPREHSPLRLLRARASSSFLGRLLFVLTFAAAVAVSLPASAAPGDGTRGVAVGKRDTGAYGSAYGTGGGEDFATRAELEEQAEATRIRLQRERNRAAREELRRRVAPALSIVP